MVGRRQRPVVKGGAQEVWKCSVTKVDISTADRQRSAADRTDTENDRRANDEITILLGSLCKVSKNHHQRKNRQIHIQKLHSGDTCERNTSRWVARRRRKLTRSVCFDLLIDSPTPNYTKICPSVVAKSGNKGRTRALRDVTRDLVYSWAVRLSWNSTTPTPTPTPTRTSSPSRGNSVCRK